MLDIHVLLRYDAKLFMNSSKNTNRERNRKMYYYMMILHSSPLNALQHLQVFKTRLENRAGPINA